VQSLDRLVQAILEVFLPCIYLGQMLVVQVLQLLGFRLLSLESFDLARQGANLGLQR
jgi:hypothetical protein